MEREEERGTSASSGPSRGRDEHWHRYANRTSAQSQDAGTSDGKALRTRGSMGPRTFVANHVHWTHRRPYLLAPTSNLASSGVVCMSGALARECTTSNSLRPSLDDGHVAADRSYKNENSLQYTPGSPRSTQHRRTFPIRHELSECVDARSPAPTFPSRHADMSNRTLPAFVDAFAPLGVGSITRPRPRRP